MNTQKSTKQREIRDLAASPETAGKAKGGFVLCRSGKTSSVVICRSGKLGVETPMAQS
jgi:hypothetical protein